MICRDPCASTEESESGEHTKLAPLLHRPERKAQRAMVKAEELLHREALFRRLLRKDPRAKEAELSDGGRSRPAAVGRK